MTEQSIEDDGGAERHGDSGNDHDTKQAKRALIGKGFKVAHTSEARPTTPAPTPEVIPGDADKNH